MKTIIIAGLHRSGTSYLSRCFRDAGIPMWIDDGGDHAECQELLAINERELARHGLTFRDVCTAQPTEEFIRELTDYKQRREGVGAPVYGFKEPRIASLIDGYLQVWPDALYILSVRNLMSAGSSWYRRGNCESAEDGAVYIAQQWRNLVDDFNENTPLPELTYFNYDQPAHHNFQRMIYLYCGWRVDTETSWRGK